MGNAVTFDTHALVKRLEKSGFEAPQAEALSEAFKEAQEGAIKELATKGDIKDLRDELKSEINDLKTGDIKDLKHEIALLKWMMGFILAGIVSLVLKAFFI